MGIHVCKKLRKMGVSLILNTCSLNAIFMSTVCNNLSYKYYLCMESYISSAYIPMTSAIQFYIYS